MKRVEPKGDSVVSKTAKMAVFDATEPPFGCGAVSTSQKNYKHKCRNRISAKLENFVLELSYVTALP